MVMESLRCERHGAATRLTCAECGVPICPRCMVRTHVGLRCERCAGSPTIETPRRRLRPAALATALAALAVLAGGLAVAGVFAGRDAPSTAAGEVAGDWFTSRPLQALRGTTSVVALPGGRVMVAGGGMGRVPLAASEVFEPRFGSWTDWAELNQPRRGQRAVALKDGSVLVAGGIARGELLSSAEVHGRSAGSPWREVERMRQSRLGHTMTVLPSGRVLVTGGTGGSANSGRGGQTVRPVASAELFDPESRTWDDVGRMRIPRFEHSASLLADGRVLIAGGIGVRRGEAGPVSSAEVFDPVTRRFSRVRDMATVRTDHAAVTLEDGRVLVVGGDDGRMALAAAEIFDPARRTWSKAAPLERSRRGHSATRLADGTVLVTGGESFVEGTRTSLSAAERYRPDRDAWANAGKMSCPRSEHGAALLGDDSVLVAGGDAAFPGRPPMPRSCVDRYRP